MLPEIVLTLYVHLISLCGVPFAVAAADGDRLEYYALQVVPQKANPYVLDVIITVESDAHKKFLDDTVKKLKNSGEALKSVELKHPNCSRPRIAL